MHGPHFDQVKGQELRSSKSPPPTSSRLLQSERARASSCPISNRLRQITPFTNRLTGWAGLRPLIRSPHWPNLPSLQSGSTDRNTSQSNSPILRNDAKSVSQKARNSWNWIKIVNENVFMATEPQTEGKCGGSERFSQNKQKLH